MFTENNVKLATAVVSLVTAAIALASAYYSSQRAKREVQRADSERQRADTAIALAREKEIAIVEVLPAPYAMEEWTATLKLRSDGSGVVERICRGIIARTASELRIPYHLKASGNIERPVISKEPVPPKGMWLAPLVDESSEYEGDVVLPVGSAVPPDGASFCLQQKLSASFSVSADQALELFRRSRFKHEYFGTTVTAPAKTVVVTVTFPTEYDSVPGNAFAMAFYGESEIENAEELARIRIKKAFRVDGNVATLNLEDPLRGHHYAVAWDPPPAAPTRSVE
jgi:hypothetical protein